jgi:hypothetical protein
MKEFEGIFNKISLYSCKFDLRDISYKKFF